MTRPFPAPTARRLLAGLAAPLALATLVGCSSTASPSAAPTTAASDGGQQSAATEATTATDAGQQSATTPAIATADASTAGAGAAGGLTPLGTTFATVTFPKTLGAMKLRNSGSSNDILKSGSYATGDGSAMASVAVNVGQTDIVGVELEQLKEKKVSEQYACGYLDKKLGPSCVAVLKDGIVRLATYGTTKPTLADTESLMKEWIAAQK